MPEDASRERPPGSGRSGTVAYLAQVFPLLTETFIYREVAGLRRHGMQVKTYAARRPEMSRLSLESRHLVDECSYILPLNVFAFVLHHLRFLLARPLRYLGTLCFVVTRRDETLRNRVLTFLHFGMGVHLAGMMGWRRVSHVHAHFSIHAAAMALVVSRLLDIPFSFTAHNLLFSERVILEEKIREARFIVAISDYTRRFLMERVPGEEIAGKIHVVHCGIPVRDFGPPDPGPVNEVPILLFIAQLTERKGALVLVEALRMLLDRTVSFRCHIIGDGPQRPVVERHIERLGLKDRIELPGAVPQEHLAEHLGKADIFVLPCVKAGGGDMDGIPVSLMEAMAMEIPAVSTRISGIPELIEDGESGLLVAPGDAKALADALQRLIEDRGLRARLGRKGRQKVLEQFNIDETAAKLAELFERYGARQ